MASTKPAQAVQEAQRESLRIYCVTHSLGFATPRAARVKCESGGHELDEGFPYSVLWEYCSDCQHYWLLDASRTVAQEECPACERKLSNRFFCGACKVLTAESDSPGRRKAYWLSSQGLVTPACPGCLITPAATGALKHECPEFGGGFVTTRATCPFCHEQLEAPPALPCSVSNYLEKLRRPATTLDFDPAANLLRQAESGKYILLEKIRGYAFPIVIPGAVKLGSKQEYYSSYYELFNCDNPAAGELIVLSPAVVEKVQDGWQLREPGSIDIRPEVTSPLAPKTVEVIVACTACGAPAQINHAFCKACGSSLLDQRRAESISTVAPGKFEPGAVEATRASTPETVGFNTPSALPVNAAGVPWKVIGGLAAGVVLVALFVTIAGLSRNGGSPGREPSVENKLDRAIESGNLFSPDNENAHDLYYELKNSGANDEKLRGYREKLTALLTPRAYGLINNLMKVGNDEPQSPEWLEAARSLDWAQELNPDNSFIAARAAYCRGRAAYLEKRWEEALTSWTKAADLDKTWVLPVNGIGMVHNANHNYAVARSFFLRALERDANWPFPDENIGNTYLDEKNYELAKQYYRKAVEKSPNWSKPHIHLADIALLEKDYATAVSEFETALAPNAIGLKGKEPASAQKALEKARQKLSEEQGY
jgi:tetratricopeptide (TPR) repeat protein